MANIRPELLDYLKTLELEAYKSGNIFAVKAPTWKVSPKSKLEHYFDDFAKDEVGALRDYAAVPTHSTFPFFKDSTILDRNASTDKECPINSDLTINNDFRPIIGIRYFVGCDLSVSGDATGFSMCHYDLMRDKVVMDFMVQIKAEFNGRVDYAPIRECIYLLKTRGFNIYEVAFDQFQSNDSINILLMRGIKALKVNYAETFPACMQVHELIYSERLEYSSKDKVFIGEAKELQVINSKRIDHLMSEGFYNSKDVWDSAVNCIMRCLEDHYSTNGAKELETQKNINVMNKLIKEQEYTLDNGEDISWLYDGYDDNIY